MKKICVLYGNCQMDGLAHFLRKTRMGEEYECTIVHNWQVLMGEQSPKLLLESLPRAEVVIYQPCRGYECVDKSQMPGTHELLSQLAPLATHISFAYQFNHGFFPLVKLGEGWDGWISSDYWKVGAKAKRPRIIQDYFSDAYPFDCARRFIECLAEQARREQETDIKMVPWILQHYIKLRLFLTYNHPTSALFMELASQVIEHVYQGQGFAITGAILDIKLPPADENEANMNGVMPIHPAVVRELGLEYQPTDGSIEYYRDLLEQMIKELR